MPEVTISVSDEILFSKQYWVEGNYEVEFYCFRHAVMRVLRGEEIQVFLSDGSYSYPATRCADCQALVES